ncbi:hypothetical protein VTP01DRAFT_6607 [Rhizomucor pusillus]|uniref:uncharacterized protein n=1 Tax=Rhizomucor pusillus TaxID=4840 RepID=UPI003743E61C
MSLLKKCVVASLAATAVYAAIVILLSFSAPQRLMIYLHWIKVPLPAKFAMPEYYGFAHNQIRNFQITTADNITLGAWHMIPTDYFTRHQLRYRETLASNDTLYDDALADPKFDTVIYFHGNAMHRAAPWRTDLYKRLGDKFGKLNIVAVDYRGFGDSEGTPFEEGLYRDARATLQWLQERNVPAHRISLIGHSLGTGVATCLAYEMTQAGSPPRALILKAAYSSLPNIIFEFPIVKYVPILSPLRAFPPLQDWVLSKLLHTFDTLSRIEHLECPILIAYGSADLKIPGHNSQLLFHRAVFGAVGSPFTKDWVEQDNDTIDRQVITNEATVYRSKHKPNIRLVKLHHADHNNVNYYDYLFESMADTAGWKR